MSRIREIVIFALCILLALAPAVSANSGPTYWEGTTASGMIVTGESCPIEVAAERLTFDLSEFPEDYYREAEDFAAYSGSVTAEYTFHNPTDADVTVGLLFPFGVAPDYAPNGNVATEQYAVTADGAPVEAVLRHSMVWGSEFSMTEDAARLSSDYLDQGFYHPDTPVTILTFRPEGVELGERDYLRAQVRLDTDPEQTKYILDPANSFRTGEGYVMAGSALGAGDVATLYVIGQVPEEGLSWVLERNQEAIPGTMECVQTERTTLLEYLLSSRPAGSVVSDVDWYNGAVELLERTECGHGYIDSTGNMEFMNWFQYELTIPAGGTVVNTVTAPMYPDIHLGWEPAIYNYEYLLSPAGGWADFGTLDIELRTPFYMTACSLEGFEETDEGYALHLDGLPEQELSFTLCTRENPAKPGTTAKTTGIVFLALAGMLAFGLVNLRHRKVAEKFDRAGNLRSGGTLLTDYDEEQKYVDQYSK